MDDGPPSGDQPEPLSRQSDPTPVTPPESVAAAEETDAGLAPGGSEKDHGPGLGERAAKGALVTFSGQLGRILLQVISVVILARLLSPSAYGVVAMVLSVIGIGEIFRDFGLSSAAIQAKTLSNGQRDNLFWLNTGIGLVLAALVFFGAGLIAAIYQHPELEPLARVLSVTFVMNGIATQYRADLNRKLKFALLTTVDVVAPAIGLTAAIIGASIGWSAWALVAQQLVQGFTVLVLLVIFARWIPGLPDRTAPTRGFLKFGGNLVLTAIVGYVAQNTDSLTIGIRFGATSLGIYNRSFQLLMTPLNQLRTPTTTVALPILSRLSEDPKRFGDFVARGQLTLGYSLVGILGIVAGAAGPATAVLLGTQWTEVTPILRILAIAGMFQTLAYVGYWVYLARGLTASLLRYSTLSAVIKIATIIIGSQWGVIGVAIGYMIAPAISWPISLWWLSRITILPTRRLVWGAIRILGTTAISGPATWLISIALVNTNIYLQLVGSVVGGGLVYLAVLWFIPVFKKDALDVFAIGQMVLKNRRRGR